MAVFKFALVLLMFAAAGGHAFAQATTTTPAPKPAATTPAEKSPAAEKPAADAAAAEEEPTAEEPADEEPVAAEESEPAPEPSRFADTIVKIRAALTDADPKKQAESLPLAVEGALEGCVQCMEWAATLMISGQYGGDPYEGIHWAALAARNGSSRSAKLLATLFEFGAYLDADPVKAAGYWYQNLKAEARRSETMPSRDNDKPRLPEVIRLLQLQLVVDGHATAFTTREFDDSLWRAILRAAEAEGPSIDIATAEAAAEPLAGAEFTALRERAATLERTGQVAEAYFLYKLALAANPPKEAELRDHLGKMLSEGTGELAPDTPAAIAYFRAGAEAGEVAAMTSYAFALHGGSGVPRDEAAGQRWFIEAAKAGAPDGNANVCLGYVHGNRLAEDAAMGADYCYEALVGGAQPVFDILSQLNQEGYVQPFRERLQQLLQDGGFYSGTIDGNFGPMSRAAVEAAFASGVEGEVEVEPAEQ